MKYTLVTEEVSDSAEQLKKTEKQALEWPS